MALPLVVSCGDVNAARLEITFADEALELQTRALRIMVRTLPSNPELACVNFESAQPPAGVDASDDTVPYPVADPVLVNAIDLSLYEQLTFVVLAYPSLNVQESQPIAGACDNVSVSDDGSIPIRAELEAL